MKVNKNIVSTLLVSIFLIQLIIISYNHYSGNYPLSGIFSLLLALSYSTALSSVIGIIILYLNIFMINISDVNFPWAEKYSLRIIIELLWGIIVAALMSTTITLLSNIINPYRDGLQVNIVNNFLITTVINLLFLIALEAYHFYRNWQLSKIRSEELERESTIAQLEALKSHINPHFLFNSLNVLSTLIGKDPDLAQKFLNEFASVFRYITETAELQIVELNREIEFTNNYLLLQKIRFGDGIQYDFMIDSESISSFIPPLSIQTSVENSIKHNSSGIENPLKIKVFSSDGFIVIENNLQIRIGDIKSTKSGIKNLKKRYSFLTDALPEFYINNDKFIAKLPLIQGE